MKSRKRFRTQQIWLWSAFHLWHLAGRNTGQTRSSRHGVQVSGWRRKDFAHNTVCYDQHSICDIALEEHAPRTKERKCLDAEAETRFCTQHDECIVWSDCRELCSLCLKPLGKRRHVGPPFGDVVIWNLVGLFFHGFSALRHDQRRDVDAQIFLARWAGSGTITAESW